MKNKMLFNLPLLTYFLIMSNPAITGETNEKLWIPGNPFLYPGKKVLLNEVVAKTPSVIIYKEQWHLLSTFQNNTPYVFASAGKLTELQSLSRHQLEMIRKKTSCILKVRGYQQKLKSISPAE